MYPRVNLAALAVASLFSIPAHAAATVDEGLIVVTATRQATRHNELLSETTVIDREEIAKSSPLETLGDLLARQNGVETVTTGGPGAVTNIFIRGANGGHTLLLIDGMRVGSATLGEAGFQRIPLDQVERVEILRGPASGLYGADAIGGVIQVFTRPVVEGTQLSAQASVGSFNTYQADAGFATRSGGLSASLRVGKLESDGFNAIHNSKNPYFNADDDGYENTNLSASLGYAFNQNHQLGLNVFNSDGENQYDGAYYDNSYNRFTNYDFRTRHKVSSVSAFSNNRLSAYWSSKVLLGRSIDDSVNYDQPNQSSRFKTEQRQLSWQNDVKLAHGKLMLAAERLEQEIDTSSTYDRTERHIDSLLAGWTASFGQHRLQANVRHDRNSQFGNKTTGNLGYGYQFNDLWRLRSSAGTAFKAPTFNDLYFPEMPFVGGGNPKLSPEKAHSREIGLVRESTTGSFSLTAFETRIQDLISWQPDDANDPYSAWHPANIGKARLRGVSIAGKQRYGSLSVRGSADFLDHKDATTGNATSGKELTLRARQHGSFGVEQQLGKTMIGAEVQAVGRRYDDAANKVKLGGYALLNLQLEHQLAKGFNVFVKANNVFDRSYEVRDDFATAGSNVFVGLRYSNQ